MDQTADFYSRPSNEFRGGAGFNVFAGSRRQRGGGIFGTLKNFFTPVAAKLGKSFLSQSVGLVNDVARDVMEGTSFKKSLVNRGKSHAIDFGKSAAREGVDVLAKMIGKGSRRAPRRRKRMTTRKSKVTHRHRRRKTSRKVASRKRHARSTHRSKAKRRRVNF